MKNKRTIKTNILVLIIVSFFITACSKKDGKDNEVTTEAGTETISSDSSTTTEDAYDNTYGIIRYKAVEGKNDNLWQISNNEINSLYVTKMFRTNEYLILISTEYSGEQTKMKICPVNLKSGVMGGTIELSVGCYITVQTDGEKLGITDCDNGKVYLFEIDDYEISLAELYKNESNNGYWFLDARLENLYIFDWESGISKTELATGNVCMVIPDATEVSVKGYDLENVVFSYLDKETQMIKSSKLLLNTGTVSEAPLGGNSEYGYYVKDTWLLGDYWDVNKCYIYNNGSENVINTEEERAKLLYPTGHILLSGADGKELFLYDSTGKQLSYCKIAGNANCFLGNDIVWCEELNGYFLVKNDTNGSKIRTYLLFWDISVPATNYSDLKYISDDEVEEDYSGQIYDRAKVMSQKYGVEIFVGKQCGDAQSEYFNIITTEDETMINNCLDILDKELSSYPSDFFKQLKYGNVQKIQFYLVGDISPINSEDYVEGIAAFAQENRDKYIIHANVNECFDGMFYHEITHLIDSRLEWDSNLREEALFSEDVWMTYQPEGFEYGCTYGDLPQEVYNYYDSGYFVSNYAMRYPTEDRATMMEHAMTMDKLAFDINPYLDEKLQYYSECIRDCFDSSAWPEVCTWEKMLYQ